MSQFYLSMSVYSCIIFIWDVKQTDVGRDVILKSTTFKYISIVLKKIILSEIEPCSAITY